MDDVVWITASFLAVLAISLIAGNMVYDYVEDSIVEPRTVALLSWSWRLDGGTVYITIGNPARLPAIATVIVVDSSGGVVECSGEYMLDGQRAMVPGNDAVLVKCRVSPPVIRVEVRSSASPPEPPSSVAP